MFISPTQPVPERREAERVVGALRAAGEQTRLRALALLTEGELAVGELAQALAQSQPRVSRHLKLLTEAGLVERAPEGAWVFYRLPRAHTTERQFAEAALGMLDPNDPMLVRDAERLNAIRAARDEAAAAYFERNAADWERVRSLHLPEADIDSAILTAAGAGPFELMVDVGVGQGRMIQLFADRVRRAEGFDTSRQMLTIARATLDDLKAKAAVRFGDAYAPPIERGAADLVTIHQVLHFLSDPARAIAEAARLLKRGGRLVIVDFAPHQLEFLRTEHAHRRLGFADAEIRDWCEAAEVASAKTTTLAAKKRGSLTVKIWAGVQSMSAHAQNLIAEAAERLGQPRVSFEFFPPKTEALETQLWQSIRKLEPLAPSFVSVTYGAGGSTRDRTHRTVARIVNETALRPAAHLTCVGASRDEVDGVLREYWNAGVRHIVALRGDPPGGVGTPYQAHAEGYEDAAALVAGARRVGAFDISVAVHPEKHPASVTWAHDIENFKKKLAAGASRGISQFFFDADIFLRFRDRLAAAGVTAPIVPGIMPVTNVKGLKKMAEGCGAALPGWLVRLFDGLDADPDTRRLVAAATTAQLCAQLAAEGVEDFHFYTLNRADLTLAICRIIGVRAKEAQA